MDKSINLPRRSRGDLVAAARAGANRDTLEDYEEKRRKRLEQPPSNNTLRAPIESKRGGVGRIELDRTHFEVLQTISLLASRWKERLEGTGVPAMEPAMWRVFSHAVSEFEALEGLLQSWIPTEAATVLELIKMRDNLAT